MNGGRAYQQYKKTQVQTTKQENLVIMLYQGAVKFLFQAEKAMQEEDHQAANDHLLRVQEMVNELRFSLDVEGGGEVAGNLYALYDYMYRRLVKANMAKDPGPIREIRGLISELLGTWREAAEKADPEEMDRVREEFERRKAEAQQEARERQAEREAPPWAGRSERKRYRGDHGQPAVNGVAGGKDVDPGAGESPREAGEGNDRELQGQRVAKFARHNNPAGDGGHDTAGEMGCGDGKAPDRDVKDKGPMLDITIGE